ncbi:uncharacterized protein TNCV_2883451 [Trichonephila clavipes]|nr:uncharacterized protein TNCV_2883451 [Trichonephila clavipes]
MGGRRSLRYNFNFAFALFTGNRDYYNNVGASRFNALYGRQGCILARTVGSNQSGRIDEAPTGLRENLGVTHLHPNPSLYSAPISLINDNGPQFISNVFEHLSHRLDIKHIKTVTYRPQANLTERVNRIVVQMIACFVEENPDNWDRFLHEFSFALRTAVNETTRKTPAELFLGRKIITPFRKLINVTEGAEYVGGNIEKLFDEARQNRLKQNKTWGKYYNRKRREVNIKVNDLVLVQTHFMSAAGRRVVGKFMPKFEGPYRVLEVRNNNLIIWKKGRSITVNIDQVRVYHPRQSNTISFDSNDETLYEGKGSTNGSSRSHPGKSRSSRRTSGDESKGRKSQIKELPDWRI